jgi:plastocyanin
MHVPAPKARRTAIALALAALVTAACGGGSDNNSGGGGATKAQSAPATGAPTTTGSSGAGRPLALTADKTQLKFDKTSLSAPAGRVTIVMTNPSSIPHDVAITGNGVNAKGRVVADGGKSLASTKLKAGTYTFYCSVDAHRQAGMQGTLTVR